MRNLHYESARHAVNKEGYQEVTHADDMNMSKPFRAHTDRSCQNELHEWGAGNSAVLDPGKEEFHVFCGQRAAAEVSSFRLVGVIIVSKLLMREGRGRKSWRTSRMASESIDEGSTLQ